MTNNTDSSKGGRLGDLESPELHSKSKGFKSVHAVPSKPSRLKSLYRVHRLAWQAYKSVWRGGFTPMQGPYKADLTEKAKPLQAKINIGIKTTDSYDGYPEHIPTITQSIENRHGPFCQCKTCERYRA